MFLFLVAASFFGTLISELNEIVAAQTMKTKEIDEIMAAYLTIRPRWEKPTPVTSEPKSVVFNRQDSKSSYLEITNCFYSFIFTLVVLRMDTKMIFGLWNWERFHFFTKQDVEQVVYTILSFRFWMVQLHGIDWNRNSPWLIFHGLLWTLYWPSALQMLLATAKRVAGKRFTWNVEVGYFWINWKKTFFQGPSCNTNLIFKTLYHTVPSIQNRPNHSSIYTQPSNA